MRKILFFCAMIILLFSNCGKDDSNAKLKKVNISGFVQKGPFVSGTSITIYELDSELLQTGKSFNTQIVNNSGGFEVKNIELISEYVLLRADGFYFNEIMGERSISQLTLYAIADISENTNVNINILSHLERSRVEYLVAQGADFAVAKTQAQNEVLDIFGFTVSDNQYSESLDISQQGENNSVLLASSLILHGLRSEGELTELLANISNDIKEDGILSNTILGSQLINHALYLDLAFIRGNLEKRYSDLGIQASIPDFEDHIQEFIDGTDFEISETLISYPDNGIYGPNILDLARTEYQSFEFYSLAANLAKGTKLKIKITALGEGLMFYAGGSEKNWSLTIIFEEEPYTFYISSTNSGVACDAQLLFDSGEFLIEYSEMHATVPTRTKTIVVSGS